MTWLEIVYVVVDMLLTSALLYLAFKEYNGNEK